MRPALVLVLLLGAAIATDGCFNLLLYARPDAIDVASPLECDGVWQSNQRTIHAARVDDEAGRAVLISTYALAPHVLMMERFQTTSGALIDAVALEAAPTAIVDACVTAYDVWAASADGALLHWDAVSGQRRPVAMHPEIAASDRVWLACSASRVWASVPAARAVWEIDVADGRVSRVVARLAAPNIVAVGENRLWIIDGAPGVTAWTVDIANDTDTGLQRAAGAGLRAMPLPVGVVVNGAAVRSDGALLLMNDDGSFRTVATAGARQPVSLELSYTTEARALASATHAVRGAGSLVDVHSGVALTPPTSPLNNNGNLAPLAYRPIPAHNDDVRVVGTDGIVATLAVPALAAGAPCVPLNFAGWERPLTSAGGGVRALDVALDGSMVWADTTTGVLRVRFPGSTTDLLLPAVPPHAQVRAIGGAKPSVCTLHDTNLECRDLAGGIVFEATPIAVPAAAGLVIQWDGADALMLFGVVNNVINVYRAARPFGGVPEWACSLNMRDTHEAWQPTYWGVAPVGDGGFLVRWTTDIALVIDGQCNVRAIIDLLRPDAQPTMVDASTVAGDSVCINVNSTRPVRLPRRTAAGWIAVGVLLTMACATVAALSFVCIVSPRVVWQRYSRTNGQPWMRFGVKRRPLRACCSLDHDTQTSVYTVLSCVCPCMADWAHRKMQQWWTPVVFEDTARGLASPTVIQNANTLLSENDDHFSEIAHDLAQLDPDRAPGHELASRRAAHIDG